MEHASGRPKVRDMDDDGTPPQTCVSASARLNLSRERGPAQTRRMRMYDMSFGTWTWYIGGSLSHGFQKAVVRSKTSRSNS